MSCAPFNSPVLNALSYLHTKQVIDVNMNIINPSMLPVYLRIINRQSDQPLFEIQGTMLLVREDISLPTNSVEPSITEDEIDEVDLAVNYKEHVESLRRERKVLNADLIDNLFESVFTPDELSIAIIMAENGDLSLQC